MAADGIVLAVNGSDKKQMLTDPKTGLSIEMRPASSGTTYPMATAVYNRLRATNRWLTRQSVYEERKKHLKQQAADAKDQAVVDADAADAAAELAAEEAETAEAAAQAKADAVEAEAQAEFERRYSVMVGKQAVPASEKTKSTQSE